MPNMALRTINLKEEDVCRTCLSKDFKMLSLFEVRLGMISLDAVISSITGLKIAEDDGLPSTICNDCKEKVVSAYEFKTRSLDAEVTLRNLLTKEDVNEILIFETNSVDIKSEQFSQHSNEDYMDLDLTSALSHFEDSYSELDSVKCENDIKQHFDIGDTSVKLKSENGTKNKSWTVKTLQKDSTYCPVCGTIFSDAEGLTKHAWDKHGDLMGPKKRGRPKKLLTSTILIKLSENGYDFKCKDDKRYNCIFCKEKFKAKEDLLIHIMAHGDINTFSCLMCKKVYLKKSFFDSHNCPPSKNPLELHKLSKPPDVEGKERPNIPYEETLLENLMMNKESESMDFCELCGELLNNSVELNRHKDRYHPEVSVRCHLCDKVFATLKSAARHRAICAQVERQFACTTCDLRFAHEVSLNKHILSAHAGQSVSVRFMDKDRTPPPYRCEICNRQFYRHDALTRHAKTHKQVDNIFECDVCSKKFNRRDNLRQHLRIHKEPGKKGPPSSNPCLCLYCGRSFSNSSNLIVHIRRHTGEKPYKCDFCSKGFPRSSDLQCHRRSHTGEKPCVCGVCGKAFSRSNKLSRHMRVHTGVKPYKCSYCEKAFSQSNDLTLHVRRHTGDKPYVCEMCGDRFIQGTALQNHRRAHGHYPPSAPPTVTPITYTVENVTQTH